MFPKSSILIGFSIINHPLGYPYFWKHPYWCKCFFFGGRNFAEKVVGGKQLLGSRVRFDD